MVLVDKEIREFCQQGKLIVENYSADNIGTVSYDLTLGDIIALDEDNKLYNSYELKPNQTVFVSSLEILEIPDNFLGIVTEKNSVMRQGLLVAAPVYQPGHKTKAYLRVTNISGNLITLTAGKKIAQIFFTKLEKVPEQLYSQNPNSSYNDEMNFTGFGNYQSEYEKEIKKLNQVKENLDEKANTIYANVMIFMGIIAAIFTIVTVNFQAAQKFAVMDILSLNLSLAFTIMVFSGIALFFLGKKRKTISYILFFVLTLLIFAANVVVCML
jgi:deoxycytidine triphosphate deaminase